MIKTCGVGVQSFYLSSLHHRHCRNENTVPTKHPAFQGGIFSGMSIAQARGGTNKFLFLELASPCKGRSRWAVSTAYERCCSYAPQLQNSLRSCCGTALVRELCAAGCSEGVSSGEPSDNGSAALLGGPMDTPRARSTVMVPTSFKLLKSALRSVLGRLYCNG